MKTASQLPSELARAHLADDADLPLEPLAFPRYARVEDVAVGDAEDVADVAAERRLAVRPVRLGQEDAHAVGVELGHEEADGCRR